MSWFTWIITDSAAHDFCNDTFLVLPIFGLAYLVQNRGDLGLRLEDSLDRDSTRLSEADRVAQEKYRDKYTLAAVRRASLFYVSFVISFAFATGGILSKPKPWLLAVVFITFASTGYALFSRAGNLFVFSLTEIYERLGGEKLYTSDLDITPKKAWKSLSPLLGELRRGDDQGTRQKKEERQGRRRIALDILVVAFLTICFFAFVLIFSIRLLFFTDVVAG